VAVYIPSSFAATDVTDCHALIHSHPLGTLFVADENGYAADHIPFILHRASNTDSSDRLLGHIARANPLARKGLTSLRCLTVFQGLNHYISPNGYASKHEDGKAVPTWNYEAVHVHGTLTVLDDPAWLLGFLERLTNTHEASQPHPWQIQDAPEEYIEALLKAIVGIEITIERYEGKFKLSQNQSDLNRSSLVDYLNSTPATESHQMAQKIVNASRG
jgi:transcriptional regulator